MTKAPYKREYKQSSGRGKDYTIRCDGCGRNVPRFKTFVSYSGLRLDPELVRLVGKKNVHIYMQKKYYCPKCARNFGIVQPGKLGKRKRGEFP